MAVLEMTDAEITKTHCIGFAWQGFGSRGATVVASVRRKLPLCLTEPMPAGSKADPLLAKAEPISDGGSASGITYLRREEKNPCATAIAAGVRSENV